MFNTDKKALELVLAIYRVTKLFPGGEVLIGMMRQSANQILADIISGQFKKAKQQIEIIINYFQIADTQEWTKQINFVILAREYQRLASVINKSDIKSSQEILPKIKKPRNLNQRQKTIKKHIQEQDFVKLKDITVMFPKLSSRTIRKDLNIMVQDRVLSRQGTGRGSFYKINKELKRH